MTIQQIEQYIRDARAAGIRDEKIRENLTHNGWSHDEITRSFQAVDLGGDVTDVPPVPAANTVPLRNQGFAHDQPPRVVRYDATKQLAPLGILLAQTWHTLKKYFHDIAILGALMQYVTLAGVGILFILLLGSGVLSLGENNVVGAPGIMTGIGALLLYVALLLFAVVSLYAMLDFIVNRDRRLSWKASYVVGVRYFFHILWVGILSAEFIYTGIFGFLVPAFIFGIWFSFIAQVLFREDVRGVSALIRSRELVQGYFWPVLGRILFLSLIFFTLGALSGGLIFVVYFLLIGYNLVYMTMVYENLVQLKGPAPKEGYPKQRKIKYYVVAFLGMILMPLFVALLSVFAEKVQDSAFSPCRGSRCNEVQETA